MRAGILHRGKACSTVVLSGLNYPNADTWNSAVPKSLEEFKTWCRSAVKSAEEDYEDDGWDDDEDQCLDDYRIEAFAHVFASAVEGQSEVQKYLSELGFEKSKAVFNSKNNTVCTLFWMPVPDFLKAIEWKRIP